MIFINNAKKKIGKEGLIINLKANNFYQGQGLRPDDFHKLYEVFTKFDSKITLAPPIKQNLFLCVLYYESNYINEAKKILEQNDINYFMNSDWSNEEKLFILFNIIEIEIKIRKMNEKELIMLYNELAKIKCDKNKFEIYLLQKHYFAYLLLLLGEFEKTDKYINNIVYDIDEKNNLTKTNLINYLRIRNEVLKVKMLELQDPDNNIKEIISHLDGLFNQTKNTKEDFAICVGIKMLSLQSKEIFTFEESIKLIQDMLNILKRETLFGKSHKNILEQYLYLSGLLGYYNSINSDFDGVMKASKKIDKYLADVSDIIKSNKNSDSKDSKGENIQYNDLFFQYSYFNTILKSSLNNLNENSSLQQNNINIKDVQKKISKKSDIDILNICVLEKDDLSKSSQFQHVEELFNEWTGQNIQIKDDKILLIYFYLYNKISNLTKKIVERMGIGDFPSKEKILEIRDFVTKIIDKTKKIIMEYNNESLKKIFKLPFFKNLFNRFYYVKIYSYYLEGKYRECLNEYTKYDSKSKIEYELQTQQSNEYMKKIEADCYFKLGEHKRAEELYDKIIGMGTNDPLIYFNLGLTAYFNNNRSKAITALEKASGFYKKENNIKKAQKIEELIEKLQQGK